MATKSESQEENTAASVEKKVVSNEPVKLRHIRGTRSKYQLLGNKWIAPGEEIEVDGEKALGLLQLSAERRPCCGSTEVKVLRYFERV